MNPATSSAAAPSSAAQPLLAQTTLATVVSCIANTLKTFYGLDPHPILLSAGIDPQQLHSSETRLQITTLTPLWLRCVEVTGDEAFGLRAARYFQPAQFYGIDLALCTSATLGEALQRYVQYIRIITTVTLAELQHHDNGDFHLAFHYPGPHLPTETARDCFIQALCIRLFERQTGQQLKQLVQRMELSRQAPTDPTPWLALGVPVTFGCTLGAIVFRASAWELPLPGANPLLLAHVEPPILRHLAQLELPLPASALRARLSDLLAFQPSLEQLAADLALSPKLLCDNLHNQGLTFSQLLDQARESQALLLLANATLSLEQVAGKLGLSSASSLSRAFRRWQNDTPLNYRRRVVG